MTEEQIQELLIKHPMPEGCVLIGWGGKKIKFSEEAKPKFALNFNSDAKWIHIKDHYPSRAGWRPESVNCLYADYPDSEIAKLNGLGRNPRYNNHFSKL